MFLSFVTLCFGAGNIVVTNSWNDGFEGHVVLQPTSTLHGWKLTLVFNKPVKLLDVCTTYSFINNYNDDDKTNKNSNICKKRNTIISYCIC